MAEAGQEAGLPINPAIAAGIAIPLVAFLMALGLRRLRQHVLEED